MPFDLDRFVVAQGPVFEGALRELRRGRKTGHWIWFIFPQLVGLGRSEMSRRYGLVSVAEASAYLEHPVLGPRLRECVSVVLATSGRTAELIFGSLDATKVRSSMTLFHRVAPDEPKFIEMLERFYAGVADPATEALLDGQSDMLPLPSEWQRTFWGGPMPNLVDVVRRSREGH